MIWLIISIIVWGIVHSVAASIGFKDLLQRAFGAGWMRGYRLFYNVFSALSFAPILYLMVVLPDRDLYQVSGLWRNLMLAGQGLSALLLLVSVLQTDVLSFVGLRQFVRDEREDRLVTGGLYGLVRHPLYLFGLLFIWLSPEVTINSLVMYVSLTFYILVGAYFEEKKLLRIFGQVYADYQVSTPMLIPGLRFGRNK